MSKVKGKKAMAEPETPPVGIFTPAEQVPLQATRMVAQADWDALQAELTKKKDEAADCREQIAAMQQVTLALRDQIEQLKTECEVLKNRRDTEELGRLALQVTVNDLKAENTCDVCTGTGTPLSGQPCMCQGTGKLSDAARYLREQVVRLDQENERLRVVPHHVTCNYPNNRIGEGGCICEVANKHLLARMQEENENLKALNEVRGGEWCAKNRAEGRGGCGACAYCCNEQKERAERAELATRHLIFQELPPHILDECPDDAENERILQRARSTIYRLRAELEKATAHRDYPVAEATIEAQRDLYRDLLKQLEWDHRDNCPLCHRHKTWGHKGECPYWMWLGQQD